MATITHTGEVGSVGGGGFVATITHTGEVESVGGGGLCGYLYIQVRWGAWGGGGVATITHTGEVGDVGGELCGYHYPYR